MSYYGKHATNNTRTISLCFFPLPLTLLLWHPNYKKNKINNNQKGDCSVLVRILWIFFFLFLRFFFSGNWLAMVLPPTNVTLLFPSCLFPFWFCFFLVDSIGDYLFSLSSCVEEKLTKCFWRFSRGKGRWKG